MKSLPAILIAEKNRLSSPDPWLLLLEVNLTDGNVFRLARNTEDVTYNGNVYTAFSFQVSPAEQEAASKIPTVTLRVSNITRLLQPYIEDINGGIGSSIKIIVVNYAHLTEDYSGLTLEYDVIECTASAEWIDFTLGASNPLLKRFPPSRYFADSCRWRYRGSDNNISIECNYTPKTITNISQADPGVVTATAHGFETGDVIWIEDVAGMVEVNDSYYTITKLTVDTFSIGVDTSGYAAYISGGTAGYYACDRTYQDCAGHENLERYGGYFGLKVGGVSIA